MNTFFNIANQILNSSVVNGDDAIAKAQTIARAILYTIVAVGAVVCIIFIAVNGAKLSKIEDDQQYALAKKRIKASIIGLVICVGAGTIGAIIIELAQQIFK